MTASCGISIKADISAPSGVVGVVVEPPADQPLPCHVKVGDPLAIVALDASGALVSIPSPLEGTVIARPVRPGDAIHGPGTTIATLRINEGDYTFIQKGNADTLPEPTSIANGC